MSSGVCSEDIPGVGWDALLSSGSRDWSSAPLGRLRGYQPCVRQSPCSITVIFEHERTPSLLCFL